MFKKVFLFILALAVISVMGSFSFAQETKKSGNTSAAVTEMKNSTDTGAAAAKEEIVKGTVKEIAEDGSSIVVDTTKILTTKEFLEDSYLEVGDKVEITVEKAGADLKAVNYNYIFEDEEETGNDTISAEAPADMGVVSENADNTTGDTGDLE